MLIDLDEEPTTGRDCFYFYPSAFHALRDSLDGAALECRGELQIFVNEFSPRYPSFLASRFLGIFAGGVWDPVQLEKEGMILRLDGAVDRGSEKTKLDVLVSKYGLKHPHVLKMTHMIAETLIPDSATAGKDSTRNGR